jgi:hypothetical protein
MGYQRAVLCDCLLDIALNSEEWKDVASRQDLVQFASLISKRNIIVEPQSEEIGFIKALANRLELCFASADISSTQRLVDALTKSASDNANPDRQYLVVSGNRLIARVPHYEDDNLGHIDNLGKHLRWAATVMGIKDPKVRILKDPAVGTGVQLTARVERMMDNTIAALALPPSESGDKAEFKSGLKGNLVELLAAIKLSRKYAGAVQKKTGSKDEKIVQTTLEDLKKSVNARAGLMEPGVSSFTQVFVKNVFNELTKPNGKLFPGNWLHSLKVTNNVKNNIGIIYKLGYESKVPAANKVITVTTMFAKVQDKFIVEAQKKNQTPELSNLNGHLVQVSEKTRLSGSTTHREFRLGVMLLLPMIDPKDARSPKDQLSVDPLSVRDKKTLAYYSGQREIVDALNLAYATYVAAPKRNSKATPLGYESAKGHAIRLSANREFMDRSGRNYQKFSDIPEHIREYLAKLLRRKISKEDQDDAVVTAGPKSNSGGELPPAGTAPEVSSSESKERPPIANLGGGIVEQF